jgi:hypothetical protein
MKQSIPASYIFSYWIFAWSVIYILAIWTIRNPPNFLQWFNPTLVLLIAFIVTSESLIRLYLQGSSWNILLKYTSTIVAIKAIPLYFIYRFGIPFGWNIHTFRDLGVMFVMFLVYMAYLWVNGTTYEAVYTDLTESIEKDEHRTPFEGMVHRIFGI